MDKFRERSRRSNTWQLVEIYTASSLPIYLCLRSSSSRTVRETRRSRVNLPIGMWDPLYLSLSLFLFLLYFSLSRLCFSKFHQQRDVDRASLYTYTGSFPLAFLFPRSLDRQIHLRTSRRGMDGLRSAFAVGNSGRTIFVCAMQNRCASLFTAEG